MVSLYGRGLARENTGDPEGETMVSYIRMQSISAEQGECSRQPRLVAMHCSSKGGCRMRDTDGEAKCL